MQERNLQTDNGTGNASFVKCNDFLHFRGMYISFIIIKHIWACRKYIIHMI